MSVYGNKVLYQNIHGLKNHGFHGKFGCNISFSLSSDYADETPSETPAPPVEGKEFPGTQIRYRDLLTLYSWIFLDEGPLDGGEDEEEGEDLDEEEMDSDDSLP